MLSRRLLLTIALGVVFFAPAGVRGEDNKALVRRWTEEVVSKGNLAAVGDFMAPTYVAHAPGVPDIKGPDGFRQFLTTVRTAFPDFHSTIEDMIAEGDKVAVRFTNRGTQKGEYRGVAPTGKEMTWTLLLIIHIANGKFQETWQISDLGRQLGLALTPGQSKP